MTGRGRRRPPPTPAATVVDRLAVLLSAGVTPASAWRHVGEAEPDGAVRAVASHVGRSADEGVPVSASLRQALEHRPFGTAGDGERHAVEWAQVACAWYVAERSGAPLSECLGSFVAALRQADAARREVEVALSGPRSTGRIVLALPPVGLLFSLGLGFDTASVLFGSPVGWGCLGTGGALVLAARAWNGRLVRSAVPSASVPGLRLELLAVAVSGGGSWQGGLDLVDEACRECPGAGAEDDGGGEAVLELSRRAGAPAGALLRAAAAERRLDATTAARSAASRLGSTLMLPLGICVLPAFLVVGVVPLVVALLSSTAEVL
ncbi:type II secretion system F family protein [Frigoribacterium sp. VKM Ac-2530]|uniref:type II secretion system F family protein n=1 Tax=Frigoribacterium sp. VKM Ac-2530 TaxID=2783822 RepID=UPI00188CE20B|nr:type II secretion system F family protein [Frigoribacterium sp. VKM Ac-2530]MBF4578982.1 type II secretion system F family protein [Frigoribacterium sp. VKM Ac-2530]